MKLSQKELEPEEIDAIVFKVIRANQERGVKKIFKLVKNELPSISDRKLMASIGRLIGGDSQ